MNTLPAQKVDGHNQDLCMGLMYNRDIAALFHLRVKRIRYRQQNNPLLHLALKMGGKKK
jgi:hypothetical protein